MAPAIPDRWLNYKPVGKRIEGTRFIAFKVPLREHVVKEIKEDNRLDTDGLLQNIPNLGLIIDLTNTNRYYDPEFFRKAGVEHKKLMIPGHFTPSEHLVNKFKLYVLSFLNENKDNDKLIGVHCTHGVNRTGYLICHFMISELTLKPNEAIERFDAARGHQIERENYLGALQELANAKNICSDKTKTRSLNADSVIAGNNRSSYVRRPDRREDFYHRTANSRGKIHKPTHTNDRHNHRSLEKYGRVENHHQQTATRNNHYSQNHTQSNSYQRSMQQNSYVQHSYGQQNSQRNERNNSMSQSDNFSERNRQNHYNQPSHSYRPLNQTPAAENYGAYRRRQHGNTPYSIDNRPNRLGSERDNSNKRIYKNAAPHLSNNYKSTNQQTHFRTDKY